MRPPQELLYDSEASLRLVDHAIEELSASGAEVATTGILDGLSRAVVLVEQLDSAATLSDAQRHQMAASLREELSGLSNHLQFQAITSQQLAHIAALLGDMQARLSDVGSIVGPASTGGGESPAATSTATQDPLASDNGQGQPVADEIFARKAPRKTA